MAVFFVYVNGLRGPAPQLWFDRPTNGAGQSKTALQLHELDDACAKLPLDQLVAFHPYKGLPTHEV